MKSVNDLAFLVWEKGKDVPDRDRSVWRFDDCGALIRKCDYGQTTEFGWEIDHIKPVSKGGRSEIWNLQPLQWENNRAKSDGYEIPKVRYENGHNRVIPFYGILLSGIVLKRTKGHCVALRPFYNPHLVVNCPSVVQGFGSSQFPPLFCLLERCGQVHMCVETRR